MNGRLRQARIGGKLHVTQAVARLPPQVMSALLLAASEFDDFTPANAPWGEHDFGCVTVNDETSFWKIDSYDVNLEFGSPDPADESVTRRVLTLMVVGDL